MCRLAAWSNWKVDTHMLEGLQLSMGGDGDGFISFELVTALKETVKEQRTEYHGDFIISRFMPHYSTTYVKFTTTSNKKSNKKGKKQYMYDIIYKPVMDSELITYLYIPQTAFYHTRLASIGNTNIDNTHPAHVGDWLVMQNGTESKFSIH
ncbi:MAG: hypothetical protein J7L51_00005, partial [Desulfurococcales archaeon]|nr:hypothetical protein [Desulfurococcales archaeon]